MLPEWAMYLLAVVTSVATLGGLVYAIWISTGGRLYIVRRHIAGSDWKIPTPEVQYRERNRKLLEDRFWQERQQFEKLGLGCRLEHEVIEEE